ncbi:DUF192 domain-containing protein [Paenibacillus abyssi]|uniref:DUF192 domain-containing protein n=1 Tax=Paenibacillus abyssi TaxID=1340531 RepID=A0A917CX58_9BACL|nr:DUF192 domain-containing protein [Paenibacillus abyssi]GGG00598.1 hypothetical protein GCM10010916_17190 [Paenibacillus abyssi]
MKIRGYTAAQLINAQTKELLAYELREAQTFLRRLKGLMFTNHLPSGTGLHLAPCQSIHTFFMNYAIDVIYLDDQQQIVGIENKLQPGKLGQVFRNSVSVIELPAGTLENSKTRVGHTVRFQKKEKERFR